MNAAKESGPSDVELLLPWHAAGTLCQRDRQRIEAAIASDPELARRYELVREELGETIHLNEILDVPSALAMDALFAKIDAEPARVPSVSVSLAARIREFFATLSPRTLAWSASAALLAILLQAGLIVDIAFKQSSVGGPGSFRTASVPINAGGEGSYALMRFQAQANAADINQFLESNKLSIAEGPLAGGLFRVRVSAAKVSKPELADIVKKLQRDKVVGFIAPAE